MTRGSNSDAETKELLGAEMRFHGDEARQFIVRCNAPTIACIFFTWIVSSLFLNYFISALRHPPDIHGLEIRGGEFLPAYKWIEKEVKTFTGTAIFSDGDIAYREHVPGVKEYIDDGPESERNWDALVNGRYFYISEEEARSQWPDTYLEWYHDEWGWIIGLDVFHTLHCVRMLRHVYHHPNDTDPSGAYHIDHCLDVIRQALECYGDLTPIPLRKWPVRTAPFTDSDQTHTCRNVSKLREFVTERRVLHAGEFGAGF